MTTKTTNFREFLRRTYAADPAAVGEFANQSCVLVRVNQRYFRGQKIVTDDATVAVKGETVGENAVTRPRWKLLPDKVGKEFQEFGRAVDLLLSVHCATGGEDDEGGRPLLTGGGNFAVAAETWPRLSRILDSLAEAWGKAADRWTTEDGYAEYHRLLREQLGDADYARVKELVPDRTALRARFELKVQILPVRLVTDATNPAVREAAADAVTELLDAAVRKPREAAAAAWRSLAFQLVVEESGGRVVPYTPPPVHYKDGTVRNRGRGVQGKSIETAVRGGVTLKAWAAYLDDSLAEALQAVTAELPTAADAARQFAQKLNSEDVEAVRVGKLLLTAARAAENEAGMCEGLARALKHKPG